MPRNPRDHKPRNRLPDGTVRKCGANKSNGEPCGLPAGYRTDHPGWGKCIFHFGKTTAGTTAALREKVGVMSEQACRLLNLDVDYAHVSPEVALLEEVRRSYGIVAWFDEAIGDKTEADLASAILSDKGDLVAMETQVWYKLYHAEREHLAKVCKMALDAGVAAAHLALLATQATELAKAINEVLEGLGLTAKQKDLAPQLLRRALSKIPVVGAIEATSRA